jgi:putative endonuclease
VVELARLESVYTRKGIKGSNPFSSAKMENKSFFVYILQSMKDFSFYVGQCDDLDGRMSQHTDRLSKYTSAKVPWKLVYFERFPTRSEAIKREVAIKKKKSRKYLEQLVSGWKKDSSEGG